MCFENTIFQQGVYIGESNPLKHFILHSKKQQTSLAKTHQLTYYTSRGNEALLYRQKMSKFQTAKNWAEGSHEP